MDYKTLKTLSEYFVINPEYLKSKKISTMKKPVIHLHIHIENYNASEKVKKTDLPQTYEALAEALRAGLEF